MNASKELLTDIYQLTMAYGYWKSGLANRRAVYHLFFRRKPFGGSFAVAAGLELAAKMIETFKFEKDDLDYLRSLKCRDGQSLFEEAFLKELQNLKLTVSLDGVPEGTPVFPYEPLLRVEGPIMQAQLLETMLLNIINFQTLIATKAARICTAAGDDEVIEFGVRRAQGPDGAISAGRAAYIGGCHATSTALVGKLYDIPVKGTQAHSFIMAFESETEAFEAYAKTFPADSVFLVDTYDSIEGVKRAISVAKKQTDSRFNFAGVRLDSGDLAHLSIEIRRLLDESGFPDAKIVASNELDEFIIRDLKQQGAKIDVWGVGTKLVTAFDQPALDGVYKLAAVDDAHGQLNYKLKISEQLVKVTDPGVLQVRRFEDQNGYIADMIYDLGLGAKEECELIAPLDPTKVKKITPRMKGRDLLEPVIKKGELITKFPKLSDVRAKSLEEVKKLHPSLRRFLHPARFFAGLERRLIDKKIELIEKAKRCKH